MSIPMKEFIILHGAESWSIFMWLYRYSSFAPIFQFLCGELPFVFGKNQELPLRSQCNSQTLNSILIIVIPASSPVDSPLLLLDGLSDLEFSASWSN